LSFGLVSLIIIFSRELSQIPPIMYHQQNCLKTILHIVFDRALPKHWFVGKTRCSQLKCVLVFFVN